MLWVLAGVSASRPWPGCRREPMCRSAACRPAHLLMTGRPEILQLGRW